MKAEKTVFRPIIGDSANKLGVRDRDLLPDAMEMACPSLGGVSVVSGIAGLRVRIAQGHFSPTMVPQRLSDLGKIPGAIGSNSSHLFRIGDGMFVSGPLTERLFLQPDQCHHGTIQPSQVMPYDEYKQAVYATQNQWVSGEEDEDA